MTPGIFMLIVIIGLLLAAAAASVTVVPQSYVYIIERFNVYHRTLKAGIHFKIPLLERTARKISRMEQMADFPPWPVITKDNVSINVDTVVFYQIMDPMLFSYAAERPLAGVENLTTSILRNVIGAIEFENILSSRDIINTKMRAALDEAIDSWGIQVNRVELQEIVTPLDLQEDMVKKLRADIEKAERIKQAEAEAEAIRTVQEATAEAIGMINRAAPGNEYLQLEALKAFAAAANGRATKIVVPTDIAGMAGLAKGLTEIVGKDSEENNA